MSSDNPKSPSWKHGAGTNRPAANASRKPWQPTQQPGAAKPVDPRSRFRKRLFAAGITGSLLIAGVIIVWWLWRPVKPPALVAVAPESTASLSAPSNVYGANSARALADWAAKDKSRPRVATDGSTAHSRDGWKAALDKSGEKTVLLYFAAHGAADRNGPYLWMTLADAGGIEESYKLPVKEILQRLAEPPLRDKQKLVIFDATQVSASWPHGFLHNDFARALKALDAQIAEIPNLVVICSTDEDQRSWVSEELQRTIFGHFLEMGLRNSAGGKSPRVNAWVLYEYLRQEVAKWTRANRDAEQTPILLPSASSDARARAIEVVSNPDSAAEETKSTDSAFTVPESLRIAWEQRAELEKLQPPPETIAPDLWRIYLDTLLRWEYLVRAGADTTTIEGRAQTLANQLRDNPLFESEPACVANSLSASRALGTARLSGESISFRDIWNLPPGKKREEVWRELREQHANRIGALRLAAAQWVLDLLRQPENPPTTASLQRAAQFLAAIEESQPRPDEAHYLLMLKYLPENQPVDLIARALDLRQKAEQVALLCGAEGNNYPYADQVHRWIQPAIRGADEDRRHAEDLLFLADEPSRTLAKQKLDRAITAYRTCEDDARAISATLRLRDRVFARLPYYARWLAAYRGGIAPETIEQHLLVEVERIAAGVHELTELLEVVPEQPGPPIVEIKKKSDALRKSFEGLETAFVKDAESLSATVLPANWHAIDCALSVPFLPADQRVKLLYSLRTISRALLTGTQTQAGGTRATLADAQTQAKRQGRMALALLGERWIDDNALQTRAPTGALPFRYSDLKKRITEPKLGAWWESLTEAGEQIGWLYRLMPASINMSLDEAARGEVKQAPPYLAQADRLSRLLDSATPLAAGRRPSEEERRYWMHEMLLWQARRTAQEGWAALDPGPTVKPYCEEAAERYAAAAQSLILGRNPSFEAREKARRLASVTATRAQLKAPSFHPDWRKSRDLTDREKPWEIVYRVTPAPGLTVGYPHLRYLPPKGPIRQKDVTPETRAVISDLAQGKSSTYERNVVYAFTGDAPENATGQVRVDLFYRGQVYDMTTQVSLAGRADIEWIFNPLTGPARFAILGSPELRQGAVALLVDRTKSMYEPVETKDAKGRIIKGKPKIEEAVAALVDVLGRLKEGTNLSIAGFYGDGEGNVHVDWIQEPFLFTGQKNERDKLIAKVKGITPSDHGESTPLARAIIDKVLEEDNKAFPPQFPGFRSVVVLTDGEDNISKSASEPGRPGRLVREALLDHPNDVALHLIFFALNDDEDKKAREQFRSIMDAEPFVKKQKTPGTIWPGVQSRQELVNRLEESMLPKVRYLRVTEEAGRVKTLPVSLVSENKSPTPVLDSGTYELRAALMRRLLRMERGDRMLLEMYLTKNGLDLRVPPFETLISEKGALNHTDDKAKRTRLTVAYNSLTPFASGYDLEMYAAMEKLVQGRDGELRMARPRFVWFEVEAPEAAEKRPTYMRIENLHDRVAPAWSVRCGPWQPVANKKILEEPASPQLRAWWIDELPEEDRRITIKELGRLRLEMEMQQKKFPIQGKTVTIESIAIEDDFLKVSLSHEPGIRVVVRIEGLDPNPLRSAPEEFHQFYTGKNQYRARFGPLSKDDLKQPLTLLFFSLDNLKDVGQRSGRTQEMELNAGRPQPRANARDLLPSMSLKD